MPGEHERGVADDEDSQPDGRRIRPEDLLTRGRDDSPDLAAMRESGVFWPGEFICPVVLADFPPLQEEPVATIAPKFLGTATLIGGDLFLSARHVFFKPDGNPIEVPNPDEGGPRPALAIVRIKRPVDIVMVVIDWVEAHPDRSCDLVIGKVHHWDAQPPWEAIASPAPLNDVTAVGYPYDRMAVLNTGDVSAIDTALNSARYVKGYVTRGVEVLHDPNTLMSPYSFEVSFALSEGMSGCPLWAYEEDENVRGLYGIASGSLSQTRPVKRVERIESDGTKVITETVQVEDYGVAVRIDSVLDWEIAQLGGRPLGLVLATAGRDRE